MCSRRVNDVLGTVDFVDSVAAERTETLALRVDPTLERSRAAHGTTGAIEESRWCLRLVETVSGEDDRWCSEKPRTVRVV